MKRIFHPIRKQVYGIHDPKRLARLVQNRVWISVLNFHQFRYHLNDTLNPALQITGGGENAQHFLLHFNITSLLEKCPLQLHTSRVAFKRFLDFFQ